MLTLTEGDRKRIEDIANHVDKIYELSKKSLRKFPTDSYELVVFTFINYLERFTYSLESIEILLRVMPKKPNVETSIGLIIRSSLLDFMTVGYLTTYYADESINKTGNSDEGFHAVLTDQVRHVLKDIKLYKGSQMITSSEYDEMVTAIKNNYSFLFKDDIEENQSIDDSLITSKHISPRGMFQRMRNHHLTSKHSDVYDLYLYYSKYEHSGIMTHFMQRQGFDLDIERIKISLQYILIGIGSVFSFLCYPEDKLIEERDQLKKFQEELACI